MRTKQYYIHLLWDTITPEGPWCVEADLVVSRTWTAVTLVDVFLTRISPPAGTTDTPLNVVTLLGSSSTFTLCFTVFSVEARVAYCMLQFKSGYYNKH